MKKIIALASAVLLIILASGCNEIQKLDPLTTAISTVEAPSYPITFDGEEFVASPATVASLSPAITEILWEIGVGEKIIGKSTYCDFPTELTSLTTIGSPANPDIDKVIELSPELLIVESPISNADIVRLEQNNIRLLSIAPPKSYTELCLVYAKLSLIFFGQSQAKIITNQILNDLDEAMVLAEAMDFSNSFVFIQTSNLAVATGDTIAGDILSVFGNNIAQEFSNYSMSIADIVTASPSIIFIAEGIDTMSLPNEIKALPAFTENKIYVLNNQLFERPTTRLTGLIKEITSKLTPAIQVTTNESTNSVSQ